jgi:hypothetical protein
LAPLAVQTTPHPRRLRVGLFADAAQQPRWVVEAFAKVAQSDFAEIAVIATARQAETRAPWWWKVYEKLDRGVFARHDPAEPLDLATYVPHQRVAGMPFQGGDLDVAFALGDLDDSALDGLARYGVWRFHADGLREVAEDLPVTGSGLQVRLAAGAAPRRGIRGARAARSAPLGPRLARAMSAVEGAPCAFQADPFLRADPRPHRAPRAREGAERRAVVPCL